MGYIFSYCIEASIVMMLLYPIYKWLMAGENQPSFNRAVILGIYAVAMIMPLLPFGFGLAGAQGVVEAETATPTGIVAADTASVLPGRLISAIVLAAWLTVAAMLLLQTLAAWLRIRGIVRASRCVSAGSPKVYITSDSSIAPFSCFNCMVINEEDYAMAGEMIVVHESCHLRLHHWIDLAIGRMFLIFNWFNPAAWMLYDELRTIHEYQADSSVLATGIDARQYQLLLIKKAVGKSFPALANSLNHSNLKNRITMMLKSKSSKSRRLRALVLVPAAAVAVAVFNLPVVANALTAMNQATMIVSADKVSEKSSQTQASEVTKEADDVLMAAEEMPQFPGGDAALFSWLIENIRYPEDATADSGVKRVIVQFVIKSDGAVGDVKIVRSAGEAYDNEAIRVVKSMPVWQPGKVGGKPVNVQYMLPINFKLQK